MVEAHLRHIMHVESEKRSIQISEKRVVGLSFSHKLNNINLYNCNKVTLNLSIAQSYQISL